MNRDGARPFPRSKCSHLASVAIAVALFLSPLIAGAKTFAFKATKQPALYSDTANWVNLDYPGPEIQIGDTIQFFKTAISNAVIIDSSIWVKGFCEVKDSVRWVANAYISLGNTWPDETVPELKFVSHPTSFIEINGGSDIYGCLVDFNGTTTANSYIRCLPLDIVLENQPGGYATRWIEVSFENLVLNQNLSGFLTRVYCDSLIVSNQSYVHLSPGYAFGTSGLSANRLMNRGEIYLSDESPLKVGQMVNDGYIRAGQLSGKVNNSGDIEIIGSSANQFAANLFDLVNDGFIGIAAESTLPILIIGATNLGSVSLNGFSKLSGDFLNIGEFAVTGHAEFSVGYFINNGTCYLENTGPGNSILFDNEFFNNDTLTVKGKWEVKGKFYNFGTVLHLK